MYAVVRSGDGEWTGGVHEDVPRPAASLLKLPLAMAMEPRLSELPSPRISELLDPDDDATVLRALRPDRSLAPDEVLRLMLMSSDNPCARWALRYVGVDAVAGVVRACASDAAVVREEFGEHGALAGSITTRDAVSLLRFALDDDSFPISASALRQSIRNSRIPLGAKADDVRIAHKTGTLRGVASDVAYLRGEAGDMWIAFMTEEQHDTLIAGYEMGICTRGLMEHFGLRATRTVSALADS